jgi:general secretion pathway protein G
MTFGRRTFRTRLGFTLIEVMIVVVVIAIIAAIVIPQFGESTKDARTNTATFSLRELRSQLELYRQHHNGKLPGDSLSELLVKTNPAGTAGSAGEFSFGPYCLEIPINPFTASNVVRAATTNPPTAASGADDAGWLYHRASGGIWIDHPDLLSE